MISIDGTLIISFLIVWGLVIVLTKLFFNPVRRMRGERESRIKEAKKASQKTLQAYQECLEKIEKSLKLARIEANKTKEEYEITALREKSLFLEEVNSEYRNEVDKARGELEETIGNLKKELGSKAVILAKRIEQRLFD